MISAVFLKLYENDAVMLAALAVISYLIGNVNFALIISRSKKSDVRTIGSGNPGTLNMSRNFGLKIGALTLILDMLKGGIPSFAAYLIMKGRISGGVNIADFARYLSGLFVVLGHIYPVFLKFKGGKGVASTLGIFLFAVPLYAPPVFLITLLFIYLTEQGSMGSLIAVSVLSVLQGALFYKKYASADPLNFYYIGAFSAVFLICFLIWFAHRKNIVRMLAGEEHKTSVKGLSKKRTKQS